MSGYDLDVAKTQKLIALAESEERGPLSFLLLTMFRNDNCAEYIQEDDIEMAKTIFDDKIVDKVVDKWFIRGQSCWTCLTPIGIDTSNY